jgi:hypothetical protein
MKPGDDAAPKSLAEWVAWYVATYEAWEQIPACWAEHPAMVNELQAARELWLVIDAETAGDMIGSARGRAEWHDYRGRMMQRLAESPGAVCAKRGEHREPKSWDREESAERRRAARQANRRTEMRNGVDTELRSSVSPRAAAGTAGCPERA